MDPGIKVMGLYSGRGALREGRAIDHPPEGSEGPEGECPSKGGVQMRERGVARCGRLRPDQ